MSKPMAVLGGAIILMGVWIGVMPEGLMEAADWESRTGLYIAASIRIFTGLFLIFTASGTRYPKGLKIFGGLVLFIGLVMPFVPLDLWAKLIQWAMVEQPGAFRVGGSLGGFLLGGFLVHASMPKRDD
jgi:hypothetical protein